MTLTYSHNKIDGGELVVLWPHRHGWLKDGAHGHVVDDRVIVSEGDVGFGQVPGPEGDREVGQRVIEAGGADQ